MVGSLGFLFRSAYIGDQAVKLVKARLQWGQSAFVLGKGNVDQTNQTLLNTLSNLTTLRIMFIRLLDRPILYACGGVAGAGHVRESNLAPTVMTAANQSIGVSQKYHHGLILPDRLIVTRV